MQAIRAKLDKFGDDLDNEEITKDVLIRPMIQALGYDSSDPTQVKAEYSVTLPKGGRGRADYVIFHNGKPAIVMECKALGVPLDRKIQRQMLQYAHALGAFVGIVTDGDNYLCYASVEDENRVDSRPFHQLQLSDPAERDDEALGLLERGSLFQKQVRVRAETFLVDIDQRIRLAQFLEDPTTSEEFYRIAGIEDAKKRDAELDQTLELLQEVIREAVGKLAAEKPSSRRSSRPTRNTTHSYSAKEWSTELSNRIELSFATARPTPAFSLTTTTANPCADSISTVGSSTLAPSTPTGRKRAIRSKTSTTCSSSRVCCEVPPGNTPTPRRHLRHLPNCRTGAPPNKTRHAPAF